ncbi:hypothetical protein FHG87_004876 [Trinorchestia longiramus]|nr:hypothetical protein FHG87_004876 [Trinorchestia longiramus]
MYDRGIVGDCHSQATASSSPRMERQHTGNKANKSRVTKNVVFSQIFSCRPELHVLRSGAFRDNDKARSDTPLTSRTSCFSITLRPAVAKNYFYRTVPADPVVTMASLRPILLHAFLGILFVVTPSATSNLNALRQQIGGYLPPVDETTCKPVIQTKTSYRTETTRVFQPFTVGNTRTEIARALATATMAVTTTMQRVEQRMMRVPVTRTYEVTATSVTTQVRQVPFQPPPVTRAVTSTRVQVQTSVNQQFVTQTQTSILQVVVTQTRVNTQFAQSFVVQTRFDTRQVTGRNEERVVTRTQEAVRTQQVPQPAFTSNVQTTLIQTSQAVQFITPRPQTRVQTVQSRVVSTAVSQIFQTQTAVATRQVVRTQPVQVTRTQVQTVTSTRVMQQVVVSTQYVDRVVTTTVVIPQVVTSTSIFNQFNTQVFTQTATSTYVRTQTVQGLNDIREQVITTYSNSVVLVTNNVQGNPATIFQTITIPCRQQEVIQTQTAYNYNAPNRPFNF